MAMNSFAQDLLNAQFANLFQSNLLVMPTRLGTYTYNDAYHSGTYAGAYHSATRVYTQNYTGTGHVAFGGWGSNTIDQMVGGSGSDIIYGGWGTVGDVIWGGVGGGNLIFGGGGDNYIDISSSGGPDSLGSVIVAGYDLASNPGSGSSFINAWVNAWNTGGSANGYLAGALVETEAQTSNNNIEGSTFADAIITGNGADTVRAGNGNDTVFSGGGNDLVYAGNGDDLVYAGDGNDVIYTGEGADTIFGEAGNDKIDASGTYGWKVLYGGAGQDTIIGGNGWDVIVGGAGSDTLTGENGNDEYHFWYGDGTDTVVEFGNGGTDYLFIEDAVLGDVSVYSMQSGSNLLLQFVENSSGRLNTINIKDYYTYAAQGLTTVEYFVIGGYGFDIANYAPAAQTSISQSTYAASADTLASLDVESLLPEMGGVQLDVNDGVSLEHDFIGLA